MLIPIYSSIKKIAGTVIDNNPDQVLDSHDVIVLRKDGPEYLREVQTNIKLGKNPIDELSDSAKKVLLAYIVYMRQNVATEEENHTNDEDAAKILHGKVFKEKNNKKLDDYLIKQLLKIGINLEKDGKGD